MKLAILTQYYPPEIGAPQARLSDLARRFVARGHQVTVITGMPNYPTGRIHAGYGGVVRREHLDGVRVIRTFLYPTQSFAMTRRLWSYASFAGSSAVIGPAVIGSADYLLTESPPLFLGPTGWWLSGWANARMIFNVSDLWPDGAIRLGMIHAHSRSARLAERLEAFCYRRAWLVSGQSKSIIANIQARFPDVRTYHLSNGVDMARFGSDRRTQAVRDDLAEGSACVVLYAGLHGLPQGLDQILAAASRLSHDTSLRFVLVGDGPQKAQLKAEAIRAGLSNVSFHDPIPFSQVPALLASADIALICLKSDIPGAVPSKLYEAMASGMPIILAASGEAAEIVRNHRVGLAVSPGDTDALVAAITELRSNPALAREFGDNGQRAAAAHFDRAAISAGFIDYLEANLKGPR